VKHAAVAAIAIAIGDNNRAMLPVAVAAAAGIEYRRQRLQAMGKRSFYPRHSQSV
jgi:hypothetical protein